ncbi:MAG: hypothetical protein O7H39_08515, partial [Gammaproteobacteria bacterium]|nr:hypothetical protein [Gammaproteobacteria bacterium]
MKDLVGFDRQGWRTGFTNYRFAVPELAGGCGRAIYNDVDQIYLTDPAELFDSDLLPHGFLTIAHDETSVMLMDCEKMTGVWPMGDAQRKSKKTLIQRANALPDLRGELAAAWNSRDNEYSPIRSKLLH